MSDLYIPDEEPEFDVLQSETEGEEIVVVAKLSDYQRTTAGAGETGSANVKQYTVNFRTEVYLARVDEPTSDAMQTVAKALHGIAAAIDAVLAAEQALGGPLPNGERARLVALSDSFEVASTGLKTGALTEDGARAMTKNALASFLDLAGGFAVGLAMGAIGGWLSASLPGASPQIKALGALGAGAFGFMLEATFGNSGAYEKLAGALVDGLFNGAQALHNALDRVMDAVHERLDPFSDYNQWDRIDLDTFEVSPGPDDVNGISPTFANLSVFESTPWTSVEVQTTFYYSGGGGPREVEDYVHSVVQPLGPESVITQPDLVIA